MNLYSQSLLRSCWAISRLSEAPATKTFCHTITHARPICEITVTTPRSHPEFLKWFGHAQLLLGAPWISAGRVGPKGGLWEVATFARAPGGMDPALDGNNYGGASCRARGQIAETI